MCYNPASYGHLSTYHPVHMGSALSDQPSFLGQPLDLQSYVPLYMQLFLLLRQGIEQGALAPGDQLPSERELVERYGVSRITASAALHELVQNGLAYRRQGIGTFVARPRISGICGFASFTDDMRARGLVPSSRLLALQVVPPDDEVRSHLALAPGALCYRLARVRLAGGEPMAVENAFLPADRFPGLEEADLQQGSLYDLFRRRYSATPVWAEGLIEAAPADEEQAKLLDLRPGEPVLIVRRVTYDGNYAALEWVRSVYRADRFSFSTGRHPVESGKA